MTVLKTRMSIPLVDLKLQYAAIRPEIDAAMASVMDQTAFIGGPFVAAFEREFASYCGVGHCVAVANGTDALFIALKTLGIGPGDEVITVANTFVATSEAITMTGAQVVFVDIEPSTFLIDVSAIEETITKRTKAIIPVHLYGQPADLRRIRAIADAHNLAIVGDAAQAHGALDGGTPIAQLADITCFSFYPGKNLGAYGDGGAIVTDREEWAIKARMFANHGRIQKYDHDFEGVNSRLDGLQAAILAVKLRYIENWTESRRRVASRYNEALQGLNLVRPDGRPNVRAVHHLYVVRVAASKRSALQEHLIAQGISTGVHYPIPLPFLNAYKRLRHTKSDFPHALKAASEVLSLPMFPELREDQLQYVADQLACGGL